MILFIFSFCNENSFGGLLEGEQDKTETATDCNIISALFLSIKFVLLQSDRHVEFHVQHGTYYRTRIPTFGRDLAYHCPSCDLYITAARSVLAALCHPLTLPAEQTSCLWFGRNEIYRLNLEQGSFLAPLVAASRLVHATSVLLG